jgi:hypothetical protein
MTAGSAAWFSVGTPGSTTLRCCACRNAIDLQYPAADHHSGWCPACGTESVFVTCKDVLIQIALALAPPEVTRAVRWAQEELDEPEFVTLLVSLTELAETVRSTAELVQED